MQLSRSEQKRQIKEVEKLATGLASLPAPVIDRIPCPDELKVLLRATRQLKGGARQRHVKYLTKLFLQQPLEELYRFLTEHRGRELTEQKQLHEMELYRDALIDEALERERICAQTHEVWGETWRSDILAEVSAKLPTIDVPALTRLAYLFVQTRNPRHSREIFRHLRAAQDQQQRMFARQQKG